MACKTCVAFLSTPEQSRRATSDVSPCWLYSYWVSLLQRHTYCTPLHLLCNKKNLCLFLNQVHIYLKLISKFHCILFSTNSSQEFIYFPSLLKENDTAIRLRESREWENSRSRMVDSSTCSDQSISRITIAAS